MLIVTFLLISLTHMCLTSNSQFLVSLITFGDTANHERSNNCPPPIICTIYIDIHKDTHIYRKTSVRYTCTQRAYVHTRARTHTLSLQQLDCISQLNRRVKDKRQLKLGAPGRIGWELYMKQGDGILMF